MKDNEKKTVAQSGTVAMSGAVSAATIASALSVSYIPRVFSDAIADGGSDFAKKVASGMLMPFSVAELNIEFLPLEPQRTKGFWAYIGNLIYKLSGRKEMDEAKSAYNEFVFQLKAAYAAYEREHEALLSQIQTSIDTINKVKPLLKDYILSKLSVKLNEMGIASSVSDYPMEHLDYRNFPLKDEYDIISAHKLSIEKTASDLMDTLGALPYLWFLNYAKAHQLKEQVKTLRLEERLTSQKMKADLKQMKTLAAALDNIACIFKDTKEVFVPLMEAVIDEIENTYDRQYDALPDELVAILQTSSKILKGLTEKKILQPRITVADIKQVKRSSNALSEQYNELKQTVLKMAS